MHNRRRVADRRASQGRRRGRRAADVPRTPTWEEQRSQHLTRYLFAVLGLIYFNYGEPSRVDIGVDPSLANGVLLVYCAFISASFLHARRRLHSPPRWRVAMGIDLVATSFAVLVDPLVYSPGYLAFLMVILGNGMRYGLRLFGEAALGSFVCAFLVLSYRLPQVDGALSVNSVFYMLFFMIVVFYSYSLTARLERHKRRLEAERDRDDLTGLLNRRALFEHTGSLLRDNVRPRLVVLFADLDGFKTVNDTHGHHIGDRVLADIGTMMGRHVRESDIVARYGGDEFVLVLPGADLEIGKAVARRMQDAVGKWARVNDTKVGVSIGIGQAPEHGSDLKEVIARVDQAMYQSRSGARRGGIRVVEP